MTVIRHPLPEGAWPDAATAARDRWFQPVTLNRITARTRTWVPAMVPSRPPRTASSPTPSSTGTALRARPAGVIVVEATGIRDVPSGSLLRIGHPRFLPGLERLVERVAKEIGGATRLLIQIIDFLTVRRRPPKDKFFGRFLGITDAHRAAPSSGGGYSPPAGVEGMRASNLLRVAGPGLCSSEPQLRLHGSRWCSRWRHCR